jgi:hypothetical protein
LLSENDARNRTVLHQLDIFIHSPRP